MDSLGNWGLRLASKVKTILLNGALNLGRGKAMSVITLGS